MTWVSAWIAWRPWKKKRQRSGFPYSRSATDKPLRFGEIVAASTIPDFAGLPLELWPGYQRHVPADQSEEENSSSPQPRPVNLKD